MGRGRGLLWEARNTSGLFGLACLAVMVFMLGATAAPARAGAAAGSPRPGLLERAISPDGMSGIVADSVSSVAIVVSANATQDEPATITVTGEAEAASRLFVYVSASGGVCEPEPALTAGEAQALSPSEGEELSEGPFEVPYEYTPALAGSYTVCAYVDETETGVPSAYGEVVFEAVRPTGSALVQVSPSPIQHKPLTITVKGETEVARKLFVYVGGSGVHCEPDPAADTGGEFISVAGGETIAAGVYEKTYEYTPAAADSYTVCAYVDESEAGVPNASGEATFEALHPTNVSIQVSANPIRGEPVTITVNGETGVARRLFVYISSAGTECESDPVDSGGEALSALGGEALAAGGFVRHFEYTPEFIATYTVCAFLDETEAATPNASAGITFTSSPSHAEIEERAAKAKAEEERIDTEHAAEVAASEAAARAASEAAGRAQQAAARAAQEAAARAAQEATAKASQQAAEKAAAEAAVAAAQAAKLKAARAKPVTRLAVSAVAHAGPSLAHPGYTTLEVTTSPYAFVTVTLARNGRTTLHREWGEQPSATAANVAWSCQHPGGAYRYTVTASTDVGRKLTRTGRFTPVSVARCRALERREKDAGKRQQAQARERAAHEYEEEVARRGRAEREEREQQESVCRQEGGTPTIVIGSEGATWACEAPGGGTLPTTV
jgi:hypothetical protein